MLEAISSIRSVECVVWSKSRLAFIRCLRILLLNLSDNCLKQTSFNAVVPSQKEMDRVGVEPTTTVDHLKGSSISFYLNQKQLLEGNCTVQIPPAPFCSSLYCVWLTE